MSNSIKYKMLFAILILLITYGCTNSLEKYKAANQDANIKTITISAAVSLKDALEEIRPLYEEKHPNVKVNFNFGSSGSLEKQIEEGAPVDIFISAGKKQMDDLQEKTFILSNSRKNLLQNELVLIVNTNLKNQITDFQSLKNSSYKISIGTPATVPAGKYAQETLENLDIWNTVKDNLIFAKDVRQVCTYVETGNVDAGLVYLSDTIKLRNAQVVTFAPVNSHKPIVYPAAIIQNSKEKGLSQDFLDFLFSSPSKTVFKKYLFKPTA